MPIIKASSSSGSSLSSSSWVPYSTSSNTISTTSSSSFSSVSSSSQSTASSSSSIVTKSSSSSISSLSSSLQDASIFQFLSATPYQASLTLDVLNKEDLRQDTQTAFGGTLPGLLEPMNGARFRGNFANQDAVWGFKETFSRAYNKKLSTTVVPTGEKVIIYIAPKGHGVGFVPSYDGAVFTETTLQFTLYDPIRGAEKTLTFSDFDIAEDSSGRYIEWIVPERDATIAEALYAASGIHGLYLMRIREISTLYSDPAKENVLDEVYVNDSYVRFIAYWWKIPIAVTSHNPVYHNVQGLDGINIVHDPIPLDGDPIELVFDARTTLGLQPNSLTDAQKALIMDDHALWYLSADLPLLPLDSPVASLLEAGVQPKPAFESPTVPTARERAFDEMARPIPARRFSLDASPVANNLLCNFADYQAAPTSTLTLSDPPAALCISRIGHIEEGFGSGAVDLSGMTVIAHQNFTPANNSFMEADLVLDNPSPSISGVVLTSAGNNVSLAFTVTEGANTISSIAYQMGVDDQGDLVTSVDDTGMTRNAVIDVGAYGKIVSNTSTLYGQIVLRTADGGVHFYNYVNAQSVDYTGYAAIPYLSAKEERNGSGRIGVEYDYYYVNNHTSATVSLYANYLVNGIIAGSWMDVTTYAYGDVGSGVLPGTAKKILFSLYDLPTDHALRSGVGDPFPVLAFKVGVAPNNENQITATTGAAISIKTYYPESTRAWNENKEFYTLDPAMMVEKTGVERYGVYYPREEDQSVSSIETIILSSSSSISESSSLSSASSSSSDYPAPLFLAQPSKWIKPLFEKDPKMGGAMLQKSGLPSQQVISYILKKQKEALDE